MSSAELQALVEREGGYVIIWSDCDPITDHPVFDVIVTGKGFRYFTPGGETQHDAHIMEGKVTMGDREMLVDRGDGFFGLLMLLIDGVDGDKVEHLRFLECRMEEMRTRKPGYAEFVTEMLAGAQNGSNAGIYISGNGSIFHVEMGG